MIPWTVIYLQVMNDTMTTKLSMMRISTKNSDLQVKTNQIALLVKIYNKHLMPVVPCLHGFQAVFPFQVSEQEKPWFVMY